MNTADENARKRAIIIKCIKDGLTPDRAIAERAGSGLSTVRRIRAELLGKPYADKRTRKR